MTHGGPACFGGLQLLVGQRPAGWGMGWKAAHGPSPAPSPANTVHLPGRDTRSTTAKTPALSRQKAAPHLGPGTTGPFYPSNELQVSLLRPRLGQWEMSGPGLGELSPALPTSFGSLLLHLMQNGGLFQGLPTDFNPKFLHRVTGTQACTEGGAGVGKIAQEVS